MQRKLYEVYQIDLDTGEETLRVWDIKYIADACKVRDRYANRYKKSNKRFYFREQKE